MSLKRIARIFFVICVLAGSGVVAFSQTPQVKPTLFAPGIISTEFMETSASFTPDGKTVYFMRADFQNTDNTILESRFEKGRWSEPKVASFSGVWRDSEPHVSPDGTKLFFVSNRPVSGDKPLVATVSGRSFPGANIWYVEKKGNGWGEPVHIEGVVNAVPMVYNPSVAKNGTLYFSGVLPDSGGKSQIYRSALVNGAYQTPERLSFSDPQWNNMDPAISPDERFIVFVSNRTGGLGNSADIYISFKNGDKWSEPVNLGESVNSPSLENATSLAPDGKTLYFTSMRSKTITFPKAKEDYSAVMNRLKNVENGLRNIWFVDISPWIDGGAK